MFDLGRCIIRALRASTGIVDLSSRCMGAGFRRATLMNHDLESVYHDTAPYLLLAKRYIISMSY